ncbi:peptidase M48 [Desulfoplanes formicivorans]|uniref:Peptidase M48 n=1 Tax=Desulfoplanes formicivorans TaxID=1592317 RepID=A0A194ALD1_9BACT|nr:peptidase M48 [Desulfoplanes formicivorans]
MWSAGTLAVREKAHRLVALVVALVLLLVLAVPSQSALFSEFTISDEAELGRKFNVMFRARFPLIEDPEIVDYVRDLTGTIVDVMPPIAFPINVHVVRNDSMNAFATAAGYVFVFSGLILNLDNEAELAGVIAHELAHVQQRHIAQSIEHSQIASAGALVGMLAGVFLGSQGKGDAAGGVMLGSMAGAQSAMLSYSREHEREADNIGLTSLVDAGYDPRGMIDAFETIRRRTWMGGGGDIPAYYLTHPGIEERIGYIEQRIARYPEEVRTQHKDSGRFDRVKTLLRARYSDPKIALGYYAHEDEGSMSCLDRLGRAIVLSRLNRIQEAERAFARALACSPGRDPLWLRETGIFYFEYGQRQDKAVSYLQEAVLRNPRDLMALFFYARILAETGKVDEGIAMMQRIEKRLPEDAEIHYYLGRMYGQKNDMFHAYLHLCYARLYKNQKQKFLRRLDGLKTYAQTDGQKKELARLEKTYKEWSQYW